MRRTQRTSDELVVSDSDLQERAISFESDIETLL